ncbi:MAG: DNA polymerase III subunit delta, partial [Oscillospiraceae bacterium]
MPILKDEEFFSRIKKGESPPVCLLFGRETHFINAGVKLLIEKSSKNNSAAKSFDLTTFAGEKLDFSALEDSLDQMPLMAKKRCVVVKDLDIEKLVKADIDKLCELIDNAYENAQLVLYTTSFAYDIKKSAKFKKVFDCVAKVGFCCDFAFKDVPTLKRNLCANAKKAGLLLEMQTAGDLIERCSQSYAVLVLEMDKLIAYVSGSNRTQITSQDVKDCCIASIESTSFDLAKAILQKNFNKAFHLLDELFFQRMEAIAIMGALNMVFFDMYRAKVALAAGKTVDDVMADFAYPKNRAFAVRNAFRDVYSFSIQSIRNCIDALTKADVALKSSNSS